jgi:hypothetical protein
MPIAYLLLVHSQPKQLSRLVKTLESSSSGIFIHVDANSDQSKFEEAIAEERVQQSVFFIKNRIHCLWGHYSLVEATLNLLRKAYNNAQKFDHFVLLSGQDYPTKPLSYIHQFLGKHKGCDFIEFFELPSDKLREKQGGLYRLNRFHEVEKDLHREFPPYSKKPILNSLFNFWAAIYYKKIRKMPENMKPYAGSQWWILSKETVEALLSFLNNNKCIEKYFKNVWIPDEIFFQTLVMHLKKDSLDVINNNLRYMKWEQPNADQFTRSPNILTINDLEGIQKSQALFARKFDEEQSLELIKRISVEDL